MPALPLLNGILADESGEFVESLPLNLEPVAIDNKIGRGQLRMTSGSEQFTQGSGLSRGAITWNGVHYRVTGSSLCTVTSDGLIVSLGTIAGSDSVVMDYSFDRLGIAGGGNLYYFAGGILIQVTDPDLGAVVDMVWMDGYFITTDGKYIVVTELNDPSSVFPLKYGSAEQDPDMIVGLIRIGTELLVLGENSIEFFQNVGGNGFPFKVQKGATVRIGCVGPRAKCEYAQTMAFVGGGRDEANGVHIVGAGTATKISTRAVDRIIAAEPNPAGIRLESRVFKDEQRLYVHLSGQTLVYMLNASSVFGAPTWYRAQSGFGKPYRIRDCVPAYGKWICGDTETNAIGLLSDDVSTHFGERANWQFDVGQMYNDGKGAQVHSVELVGLPGRGIDDDAVVFMSMTRDGRTFSVERGISMGRRGERGKRLQWRPKAMFRLYMGLRFRGMNSNMPGITACNVEAEPLSV